ncbi:MAG: hypothetical protein ACK52C_05475 [Planctomycetia bacterium]
MPQPSPSSESAATARVDDAVATALGRIPSGLFIVSWRLEGVDRTMLASWVMQA